ncbi:MAG: major capsid protein [Roseibium sp.]|uniref:major capsid protein n=1 Tax=Roseibium sp. TaxID=1936156 RepID=UPI00262A1F0F|nr:major capsid protein [Roseibium sp.]MCV0429229.1 major capsid protein [Roseibium sp.]
MPEILLPYTNVDVTEEVNRIPNNYGYLNALDISPSEPVGSRLVRIDYRDGQIVVLAAEEPGSPGQLTEQDNVGGTILQIPHFPHLETITPEDLAGIVEVVNGVLQARNLDAELAKRLSRIRKNHSITLEYIRMGSMRGLIKDGRGRTLYDLYSVFGITKKVIDLKLGTADTDMVEKFEEIGDHIQTNLKGETMSGVEALISPTMFNRFIQHPKVEKFWIQTEQAPGLQKFLRADLGGNWGRIFDFGDIRVREYKGSFPVRSTSGQLTSEPIIEAGKGHAYPAGTQEMSKTFQGPVHHIDMVNVAPDASDPIYVSTEVLKHGAGVEVKSQTNRLSVWKQPECLVELMSSD